MPKRGKIYTSYEEACEDGNGCWNCEHVCPYNSWDYRCPWKEDKEKGIKNLKLWGLLSIESDKGGSK